MREGSFLCCQNCSGKIGDEWEPSSSKTAEVSICSWKSDMMYVVMRDDDDDDDGDDDDDDDDDDLAKAFHKWKIFTEMKKEKALKNLEATDHYTIKMLKSAWKIWILYIEEKENLRIIDKLQYADSFYRGKLLQKSIKAMKIHVGVNKRKRILKEKSKCIILMNCIQVWWDEWQRAQHERKLETQAVAFYQMCCLRQTLQTWQRKLEKMKYLREMEDVASSHFKEKILHRCLQSWYCWVKRCLRRKILLIESECRNNERLLWRCFQQWRKFQVQKSEMRIKQLKAESKYNFVIKRRSLQIWKSFYNHQLLLQQQVELLLKTKEKKLMKNVLCGWQAVKTSRRCARHILIHVMDLYLSHLMRLVVSHWVVYVEMRKNKQKRWEKLVQPWHEKINTMKPR
ncbi:protein SFI1 homolog [Anabrus simplex]|uniref:protein SFI1 homolog n=1 Tax=Anabrus simplex TaxID=316456 RepID=UPI0035A2EA35